MAQYAAHGTMLRDPMVLRGSQGTSGKFGRLFPNLPARSDVAPHPVDLGQQGGPMDGGPNPQPNPAIPSGFVFLGQFIDHDLTLDTASLNMKRGDPDAVVDFRTPALDLDNVYGAGPVAQPVLYDGNSGRITIRSLNNDSKAPYDLQRNDAGVAIIGDPRNDENRLVSQFQCAMIAFHNAFISKNGLKFDDAKTQVTYHYQWMIVHEFLPLICGKAIVDHLLSLPAGDPGHLYQVRDDQYPFMPVEYSVAAYRYGHSQVRNAYTLNSGAANVMLFPKNPSVMPSATDLRGGRRLAIGEQVDWDYFFDLGGAQKPQESNKLDTLLATDLLFLPDSVVLNVESPTVQRQFRSLATRNLQRALDFALPSGQDVAKAAAGALSGVKRVNTAALSDAEIWNPGGDAPTKEWLGQPAPLWFYLLREAEIRAGGKSLGPLGGFIVADVIISLLQLDDNSYLNADANFKPMTTPFGIADLLKFAGVA